MPKWITQHWDYIKVITIVTAIIYGAGQASMQLSQVCKAVELKADQNTNEKEHKEIKESLVRLENKVDAILIDHKINAGSGWNN